MAYVGGLPPLMGPPAAPPPGQGPAPPAVPQLQMRLDGWPQPTSAGLCSWRRLLVEFEGEAFLHERLVIKAYPNGGSAWIATPDQDEYEEDYRNDPDIVGVTFLDDAGRPPAPPHLPVYAFRAAPTQAVLQAALGNAEVQTQLLGWGQAVAAPQVQAGAIGVPGAGKWLLAEPCGNMKIGDEAPVAPTGPFASVKAVSTCTLPSGNTVAVFVEWVPTQKVSDCRIMKPRFEHGVRSRTFNDGVLELFEEPDLDGFPKGPRITLGTAQTLRSQGLTWQTQAREWPVAARIPPGDRSVHEYKLICEVLNALQCVDQCNLPNLVGAELLVRRKSVLEEARASSPSNPDYSAADIMMGWAETRGTGSTPESLMSYTADRLKDKAAILKEKRKAVDESRLGGKGQPSKDKDKGAKHRCRRLQQRFDRRKAVLSRAVDSVKALNWLHGGRQPPSFSSPTLSQATALQHLLDAHRTDVPEIVNAEAARVELLGAGQDYAGGPELPIASYDKDLLSMPQLGAEPVDLSTVLEGRARECLVNFEEEILHGPDDWGHITECEEHVRPYMDPVLKSDADAYFDFVMRGHRMRESPYVRLGGPADVARLLHSRGDGDPYVALGDVKDHFHCCGLPPGLSPYFSLPPVSGLRLLQAGIHNVEGLPVLPGDSIFPQSRVVPMGWSWACYFAQSATTSLVRRFSGSEGDSFLESCPGLDRPAYNVYIDNISIFGQGKSQTDRIANQVFDGVESVGLEVHERTSASKWALTLGLEIDFLYSTVQGKRQQRSSLWSLDKSFREVPKENLVGPTWTKGVRSVWKDEEPIFCLEARAGLLAVRHKLRAVSSFGKTHLHLGGSMTAILAFEKGRADPLDTVLAEKTRRSARRPVLKRQRALKRVRAIGGVVPALRALKGERSVLESSHPSTPVRRDYCRRLDKFWEFGRSQGLSLANLKVCDDALCDFADLQFLDGEQVDAGAKLLAALEDHDVQRLGKPSLPRFRRVLRAWHRKGPVGSRDPLPFRLLAGVLGVLSLHGFHEEVLALALMFCCYLRPSELLTVVEGDLLEPVANAGVALACWSLLLRPFEREEPTKVGQFDDTLPLDSPDFPGLGALLAGLRGGDAEVWLFSFSQTQLLRRFQAACRAAGLGSLNLEMHQLRHGGASRDFLMKTREIQAVKQRGRWANDRTLLRYMKAGRVQRLHKALTPEASRWSLPRSLGGGFVIEVFSGSGRLAKSIAELGVPALTWPLAMTTDQIKDMQRRDLVAKEQWYAYCEEHGNNVRDPSKHDAPFLEAFIQSYHSGVRLEFKEGKELVQMIKMGQKMSQGWKAMWEAYCNGTPVDGRVMYDPAKHDAGFLEGFFDFIGKMAAGGVGVNMTGGS
ncbi:unnamed protein product [Prorocentrum cordatum]|uniref:Uncharacterized protein n=1 Tax=Prorocentrum cordatum TaxID=2364126 RepID=A0ABN9VM98_9DINO|nr:unnamed protein product [Polarella glacialis]